MEVDFAKAAVFLHQVVLGAAQIDLAVLGTKQEILTVVLQPCLSITSYEVSRTLKTQSVFLKFSHLLAVLQFFDPETSSLKAATVRQV